MAKASEGKPVTTPAQRKAAQRYQNKKCRQLKLTFTPQSMDVYEWLSRRSESNPKGTDVIAALRELMGKQP